MTKTPDLNIDLEAVRLLPFDDLKDLYLYLYPGSTSSTSRSFYIWRIINRLQEIRFGGLDAATKNMLINMDDNAVSDKSMPIGTEMTKKYKGATYHIRVVSGGFEMEGEFYKSLSAVAYKITGRRISGNEFLGV